MFLELVEFGMMDGPSECSICEILRVYKKGF